MGSNQSSRQSTNFGTYANNFAYHNSSALFEVLDEVFGYLMGYTATDEPSVVVVSVEGPTGKLFLVNTNEIEDVVMNSGLDSLPIYMF